MNDIIFSVKSSSQQQRDMIIFAARLCGVVAHSIQIYLEVGGEGQCKSKTEARAAKRTRVDYEHFTFVSLPLVWPVDTLSLSRPVAAAALDGLMHAHVYILYNSFRLSRISSNAGTNFLYAFCCQHSTYPCFWIRKAYVFTSFSEQSFFLLLGPDSIQSLACTGQDKKEARGTFLKFACLT